MEARPADPGLRRGLAAVFLFACLLLVPFMGKAFHNDEPFFLAVARHALIDPRHPLAFDFTWYGHPAPAAQINTTPPVLLYLEALALRASGGGEFALRLCFLPLDLLAAGALYLLAARFLRRPLLPVLILIASPAYLINMNLLMAEKPALAFGLAGLYALVRGVEEGSTAWYWSSAGLLATAVMSKYVAVALLLPAAAFARHRGAPRGRVALHALLALAPVAALVLYDSLRNPDVLERAWSVTSGSAAAWWSAWPHKLRSFLAFVGGGGVVTAVWPLRRPQPRWAAAAAAAAVLLFLPALDLGPAVRLVDRCAGMLFAGGAVLSFAALFSRESRLRPGWALWAPWTLAVALVQLGFYWSVAARVILFLLPPLVLALAEAMEADEEPRRLSRRYAASLIGVLALSLALAEVDYRYAAGQKSFAQEISRKYLSAGRRVWFTGYMGLGHYLEQAGGRGLDPLAGGWSLTRPGDVVVVLKINSVRLSPPRPLLSNVTREVLDDPVPLRLMSGWTGEGAFYSNVWGFLPYSLSREPLEEFTTIELL
jgi:hypothetical protein